MAPSRKNTQSPRHGKKKHGSPRKSMGSPRKSMGSPRVRNPITKKMVDGDSMLGRVIRHCDMFSGTPAKKPASQADWDKYFKANLPIQYAFDTPSITAKCASGYQRGLFRLPPPGSKSMHRHIVDLPARCTPMTQRKADNIVYAIKKFGDSVTEEILSQDYFL